MRPSTATAVLRLVSVVAAFIGAGHMTIIYVYVRCVPLLTAGVRMLADDTELAALFPFAIGGGVFVWAIVLFAVAPLLGRVIGRDRD